MKKYLLCVDSDGCAMDTMTVKHEKCFGPELIGVYGLQQWQKPILKRWNEINLYESTRGINRFAGLLMMLEEINEMYTPIAGLEEYSRWCDETDVFSEDALIGYIEAMSESAKNHYTECLTRALTWSRGVNQRIDALTDEEKVAFAGVKETLEAFHPYADIAVVSSANEQAVKEEWDRCGLLSYVDYVCAQNVGTKTECIRMLLTTGYDPQNVVMVGDAVGDEKAAQANGVRYYRIIPGQEEACWKAMPERLDYMLV
ncbi:MAG: HAD family hydrolase [Agathobacter sp.]